MQRPSMPQKPKRNQPIDYFSIIINVFIYTFIACMFLHFYYKEISFDELMNEYECEISLYDHNLRLYTKAVEEYIDLIDSEYNLYKDGKVLSKITVDDVRKKGAETVGYEMVYSYEINNEYIKNGGAYWISVGNANEIESLIVELDPSYDDRGKVNEKYYWSFLEINDGIEIEHDIRIHESYGTLSGNTDKYTIKYMIRAVTPLLLTKEQRDCFPVYPQYPMKPTKTDHNYSIKDTMKHVGVWTIICLAPIILVAWLCIAKRIEKEKVKQYEAEMRKYNNFLEKEKCEAERKFNESRNSIIKEMSGRSLREIVRVPSNVYFDQNNLPRTQGKGIYGEYTVYVTVKGRCFHKAKDCIGNGSAEIHLFNALNKYRACKLCARKIDSQIPEWYLNYIQWKKKCDEYGITDNSCLQESEESTRKVEAVANKYPIGNAEIEQLMMTFDET